jgi:hypothetical protein
MICIEVRGRGVLVGSNGSTDCVSGRFDNRVYNRDRAFTHKLYHLEIVERQILTSLGGRSCFGSFVDSSRNPGMEIIKSWYS